jgi:TldD protein
VIQGNRFFSDAFGITQQTLRGLLSAALAHGGDYADLYFEYRVKDMLTLEEGILKNASKNISQGVGIRVLSGDKTGYAYTDGFEREEMLRAARTAASIAHSPGSKGVPSIGVSGKRPHDLYRVAQPLIDLALAEKIHLLQEADRVARSYDPRIVEVRVVLANEKKHILVCGSRSDAAYDFQPLTVFQVSCIAAEKAERQIGIKGGGGRVGMEFFESKPPSYFARDAARQAILLLSAVEAPAGPMPVVLGPGWPGILLHEAVGHGLEADFNRKLLSAFAGRIGQKVASELCSVVDDGTLPHRRGSLNLDDEGHPTGRTILIEKGILRGYMQDTLSAHLTKSAPTGNGRRESYACMPMPRMTNTFMLSGESTNEEIIRSVRRGLYAVNFGGGQVDITSGKFVFSASEAFLIENGKITRPVKGATLIGNGPDVLTRVSMVGNDLDLDEGIGTCGKEGQSVPVGVGAPTLKVDEITVGGTTPK